MQSGSYFSCIGGHIFRGLQLLRLDGGPSPFRKPSLTQLLRLYSSTLMLKNSTAPPLVDSVHVHESLGEEVFFLPKH